MIINEKLDTFKWGDIYVTSRGLTACTCKGNVRRRHRSYDGNCHDSDRCVTMSLINSIRDVCHHMKNKSGFWYRLKSVTLWRKKSESSSGARSSGDEFVLCNIWNGIGVKDEWDKLCAYFMYLGILYRHHNSDRDLTSFRNFVLKSCSSIKFFLEGLTPFSGYWCRGARVICLLYPTQPTSKNTVSWIGAFLCKHENSKVPKEKVYRNVLGNRAWKK